MKELILKIGFFCFKHSCAFKMSALAEEEKHITSFWKHLNEFLDEVPQKQDPPEPDFFVNVDQGLIGIEHTRLVRQPDQRNTDIKGHYECAKEIMKLAEQNFRRWTDLKLYVSVSFACSYGLVTKERFFLSNRDIEPLSTFIAEFVACYIPPSGEHRCFEYYDSYRNAFNFPHDKRIRSIAIANCNHKVSQPCWTHTESGVVPQIYESQAFDEILKKKNQKPSNYLKDYYQIWLLMVEDQWSQATCFDFEYSEKPTVLSPFDRIFILRYLTEEVIELKVVKV
jgi:hypothetical protein